MPHTLHELGVKKKWLLRIQPFSKGALVPGGRRNLPKISWE